MCRLNHFILWCKGWYESVDENMDLFDQVVEVLKLDGYILCEKRNVLGILTNYIDEIIDKSEGRPNYLRIHIWHQNISHNMYLNMMDYKTAVLINIKNFFAYHIEAKNFNLTPPIYSRKLYKKGLRCPSQFGNSYKMCNYKTAKFFKKSYSK